jgi:hypothetical protein
MGSQQNGGNRVILAAQMCQAIPLARSDTSLSKPSQTAILAHDRLQDIPRALSNDHLTPLLKHPNCRAAAFSYKHYFIPSFFPYQTPSKPVSSQQNIRTSRAPINSSHPKATVCHHARLNLPQVRCCRRRWQDLQLLWRCKCPANNFPLHCARLTR